MKRISIFLLLFYDVSSQCDGTFYDGPSCTYNCENGFYKNFGSTVCLSCEIGNRKVSIIFYFAQSSSSNMRETKMMILIKHAKITLMEHS